jgi:tetratricopeptide (TPR) repeat protein
VVIHYISLLLYPHPSRLNLDYDFPLSHSLMEPVTTLFSVGVLAGLVGAAICIAKKERLISFCILWFLGNLVVESSVIALEIVYEHRTYLPSMFLFLLVIVLVSRFVKQQKVIIPVLSGGIILLCVWTYERNSIWTDPVTLWKGCVSKSQSKPRPRNNLGLALYKQGRLDEAIAQCSEALRIKPDYIKAHNTMGLALADQGNLEEAIAYYKQALQIKPGFAEGHNNLGNALVAQGKVQEAIAHYAEALRVYPGYASAHNNWGNALVAQGKVQEAIAHYAEALRVYPSYASAHNNWGNALAVQGKLQEAIAHYAEALRIDPDYLKARNNLTRASRQVDIKGSMK